MEPDPVVPHRHRARIAYFLLIFPAILIAADLLICATWNFLWRTPGAGLWATVSALLMATFCITSILGMRFAHGGLRCAYYVSAVWLGMLSYGLFAAAGALVFYGGASLLSIHVEPKLIALTFFGAALAVSCFGFANAARLQVTRVTIKLPRLPPAWEGRNVALVTDVHLGNVRRAGFLRRIVAQLEELPLGAIFISGDLFDGPKADLDALLEPWKKISRTSRIFFVTGNHEEYTGRTKFIEAVERAGVRVLNNEKVELDGLQLVGVHDREAHAPKAYRALLQQAGIDRQRASILLLHQPLNMAITAEEGISLQLSGHTHGGQFWPWVHIANRVHGRFVHGLNRLDGLQVYTSYGVGTWGAPLRVGTKSEIILIRLESAP